jgi:hypothetical protein
MIASSAHAGGEPTASRACDPCMDVVVTSCAPFNYDTTTNLCNVTCADKNDCAAGAMCKGAAGGLKTCQ